MLPWISPRREGANDRHMSEADGQAQTWDHDADLVLIGRLQHGDDEALDELMTVHKQQLFSFIYRFVSNQADAADLLEETFVKLYLNRDKFAPTGKFRTWLFQIATNLCRDWARSRKRKPATPVAEFYDAEMAASVEREQFLPVPESPSAKTEEAEEAAALRSAIDKLPHDLKMAIVLHCLEGHSQEETASLLGCTAKAVETRVYRAKKRLHKLLGPILDR